MVHTLLLFAMLFQGSAQTALKPVIDNDRVAVWDVPGPTDAQPLDAVVVSLSGSAEFLPKGMTPKLDEGKPAGRSIVSPVQPHCASPKFCPVLN